MRFRINDLLNEDHPLEPGASRRRLSEFIRSPTLEWLMKVHRRDLCVVSYDSTSSLPPPCFSHVSYTRLPAWHAILPTVRREVGLIASCDVSRVPTGFRFYANDRIVCPLCHPKPEKLYKEIDALTGKKQKSRWFREHTVAVDSLVSHYVSAYVPSSI